MNVIITEFAKKRIKKIYYYYKDRGLSKVGQQIRIAIVTKAKFLKEQPYMGAVEPTTIKLKKEYRNGEKINLQFMLLLLPLFFTLKTVIIST